MDVHSIYLMPTLADLKCADYCERTAREVFFILLEGVHHRFYPPHVKMLFLEYTTRYSKNNMGRYRPPYIRVFLTYIRNCGKASLGKSLFKTS